MAWGDDALKATRKPSKTLVDEMDKILFEDKQVFPDKVPTCCMIYGEDGTGKTGLALSSLTEEDVDAGMKIVVVDLDSGNIPLLIEHHTDKINKNAISYRDPVKWDYDEKGNPILNYRQTFAEINAIAVAAKNRWNSHHDIKAIILDGGSKLLKYSEQQMRLEKALTPDGGVQTRYWLIRNKMFLETLELYKSLPFDKYFIFHEDFIPFTSTTDKKFASVKLQTNQMMFQKVFCERVDTGPKVEFRATIHKSKFDITKEGKMINFGEVNKKEEEYIWNPDKVIRALRKEE